MAWWSSVVSHRSNGPEVANRRGPKSLGVGTPEGPGHARRAQAVPNARCLLFQVLGEEVVIGLAIIEAMACHVPVAAYDSTMRRSNSLNRNATTSVSSVGEPRHDDTDLA